MKKYIHRITIGLALFLAAGYVEMGVPVADAQNNKPGFEISFHHIGISVANLEESIAWYKEMLGFEEAMTTGMYIRHPGAYHVFHGVSELAWWMDSLPSSLCGGAR